MVVNIYYIVTHYAPTTSTYIRTKFNVLDIKNFGGVQNEVWHILATQKFFGIQMVNLFFCWISVRMQT